MAGPTRVQIGEGMRRGGSPAVGHNRWVVKGRWEVGVCRGMVAKSGYSVCTRPMESLLRRRMKSGGGLD